MDLGRIPCLQTISLTMSLYDGVKSVLQCCKSVKEAEVLLNNGIKMPVVGCKSILRIL